MRNEHYEHEVYRRRESSDRQYNPFYVARPTTGMKSDTMRSVIDPVIQQCDSRPVSPSEMHRRPTTVRTCVYHACGPACHLPLTTSRQIVAPRSEYRHCCEVPRQPNRIAIYRHGLKRPCAVVTCCKTTHPLILPPPSQQSSPSSVPSEASQTPSPHPQTQRHYPPAP